MNFCQINFTARKSYGSVIVYVTREDKEKCHFTCLKVASKLKNNLSNMTEIKFSLVCYDLIKVQ